MSKKSKKNSVKAQTSRQTFISVSTQTETNDEEILIYQEQIEILKLEILDYKKQIASLKNKSVSSLLEAERINETPRKNFLVQSDINLSAQKSANKPKKGCNCKGNCGTKLCGCVKKSIFCDENCKCKNSVCKNYDSDKENINLKENVLTNDDIWTIEKLKQLTLHQEKSPSLSEVRKKLYSQDSDELLDIPAEKEKVNFSSTRVTRRQKKIINDSSDEGNSVQQKETNLVNQQKLSNKNVNANEIQDSHSSTKEEYENTVFEFTKNIVLHSPREINNQPAQKISDSLITEQNEKNVFQPSKNKVVHSPVEINNKSVSHFSSNLPTEEKEKSQLKPNHKNLVIPSPVDNKSLPASPHQFVAKRKYNVKQSSAVNLAESSAQEEFDTDKMNQSSFKSNFSDSNSNSTPEIDMNVSLNPMVPKRQLPRSPINVGVNIITTQNKRFSPPLKKELAAEKVDWEEHQSTLVQCQICKRKFWPHRLEKHVLSCKGI